MGTDTSTQEEYIACEEEGAFEDHNSQRSDKKDAPKQRIGKDEMWDRSKTKRNLTQGDSISRGGSSK